MSIGHPYKYKSGWTRGTWGDSYRVTASLFAPVLDFMMAMLILLTVNLLFGIADTGGG